MLVLNNKSLFLLSYTTLRQSFNSRRLLVVRLLINIWPSYVRDQLLASITIVRIIQHPETIR